MSYAIVAASGTQLRVEPGRFYDVNRLAVEENNEITLDQVLFINHDGEMTVGQPLVEGASVQATVMRHLRGRKIIVYKMRPKKKTRKKQGHRQELTRIMIDSITVNGTVIGAITESTMPVELPQSEVTEPEADDAEMANASVDVAADTVEETENVPTEE